MTALRIEKIPIPNDSVISDSWKRVDYADAYRVRLPEGCLGDVESITRSIFASTPVWVRSLMSLRDNAVRFVGLKTSDWSTTDVSSIDMAPGASIGGFHVFHRSDSEIVLGEDDKHLDFRVSLLRSGEGGDVRVTITTIVRFNSWLGRAYFLPVRFFHRLIVPAVLKRGVRILAEKG